ncbi:MT-A70 family methyltransferase [Asticcacaulis sp.]|uniref:MT-A70 family methyltransferase n=1 Tax=Asticcacaulis sp. TaxID=1872648 RepID=UPI00391A60A2
MTWPFGHLTPLKYGAILVDPPWAYAMRSAKGYGKSPEAHYATMSHEDIMALPVAQLAAGDCLLFMWSTWPHLDQALSVLKAWGFTYKTGGAWFKKTVTGKSAFGTGYILRSSCEPYLIGTIGRPDIRSRSVRNEIIAPAVGADDDLSDFPEAIEGLRREHSRKPPEARAILDTLLPHAFKAELFAREPWAGADVWGNEAGRFPRPESAA